MKKNNILMILLLLLVIIFNMSVFASTNTYVRTENNLRVDSSIKVTQSNKKAILNTPSVDPSEKVYDFADLFTAEEEAVIYQIAQQYINQYNMDMVIVTINKNNKYDAMHYADDFYDYNGFGIGNTHDGTLFLIDMDTREMWISTTGQAILYYDDTRIDKMLDYAYQYISNKEYVSVALSFIDNASKYVDMGIPKSNSKFTIDKNGEYVFEANFRIFIVFIIFFFSFAASIIASGSQKAKHRTVAKATQANTYLVPGSFKVNYKDDKFMSTHTSEYYNSSSSSSHSHGGSSTHHSSSGRSHGGGGRHF